MCRAQWVLGPCATPRLSLMQLSWPQGGQRRPEAAQVHPGQEQRAEGVERGARSPATESGPGRKEGRAPPAFKGGQGCGKAWGRGAWTKVRSKLGPSPGIPCWPGGPGTCPGGPRGVPLPSCLGRDLNWGLCQLRVLVAGPAVAGGLGQDQGRREWGSGLREGWGLRMRETRDGVSGMRTPTWMVPGCRLLKESGGGGLGQGTPKVVQEQASS